MPTPRVTEAVVRNVIKALQTCGVGIAQVEVTADGALKLIVENTTPRDTMPRAENEW